VRVWVLVWVQVLCAVGGAGERIFQSY